MIDASQYLPAFMHADLRLILFAQDASCRRKQREAKRNSKEVQAERLKEKAQAKKSSISAVSKLRKQRQKSGFQGELDMDAELAAMNKSRNSGPQRISKCEPPSCMATNYNVKLTP